MKATHLWVVLLALLLLIGCGKSHDPITSGVEGDAMSSTTPQSSHSGTGNRVIWGLWKISVSADRSTIEVVPDRIGAMHFNIVQLLEYHPCSNCLKFSNVKLFPNGELSVDLTVIHPFPGLLQYTGFDLRGVIISGAGYTFPVSGRSIARGDDILTVLNSDGYTHLFNPTDFPPTTPPILGYIPGHMAPGGDLSATLNPFFAYERDQPRRMFLPGTVSTRTIRVHIPDGPLEFGYAVDVSWFPADGEVTDPENDFPPEANAFEAYMISVVVGEEPCPVARDEEVRVEVFDHQGLETINSVTVEAPDLFTGEVELIYTETTAEGSFVFTGTISNEHATSKGPHPLLARVTDTETDGNLGIVDAWQVREVMAEIGWARTWGGIGYDVVSRVAVDASGDIYAAGIFSDTVDFDPGEDEEIHVSNGEVDVFLSKFNTFGDFLWARTWGGTGEDYGIDVVTDGSGSVYVTGMFRDTVDFDPGPGFDERTSNGEDDVFVSKFTSSGEFEWAHTWGSVGLDQGNSVAVDNAGDVYVTGWFYGTVDFDPGAGIEEHTNEGPGYNAFLSKFDSSGSFQWVLTWGNEKWARGVDIAFDTSGFVYVVGRFQGLIDFDPGPGVEERWTSGNMGAFISKFNPSGSFQWVRTWSGTGWVEGLGIAIGEIGDLYVVGDFFHGTVDFDPGPGVVEYTVSGLPPDAYLSKFDTSGNFYWAYRWGADSYDSACDVSTDSFQNVYVTGYFTTTIDFDPGPGIEEHSSNGIDVYLSKFDASGDFLWTRTWGGYLNYGWGLAVDEQDNVLIGGEFSVSVQAVDFDPGPCFDIHNTNGGRDAFLAKMPPDGRW